MNWLRFGLSVAPISIFVTVHFNGQIEHVSKHCELASV